MSFDILEEVGSRRDDILVFFHEYKNKFPDSWIIQKGFPSRNANRLSGAIALGAPLTLTLTLSWHLRAYLPYLTH